MCCIESIMLDNNFQINTSDRLRLIIGESPYSDRKDVLPNIYGQIFNNTAFFRNSWDNNISFNRVLNLLFRGERNKLQVIGAFINNGVTVSEFANFLLSKNYYLTNMYSAVSYIDNQKQFGNIQLTAIKDFIDQFAPCVLVVGDDAYDKLDIAKNDINLFYYPHPSPKNRINSVGICWDNHTNLPSQYFSESVKVDDAFSIIH